MRASVFLSSFLFLFLALAPRAAAQEFNEETAYVSGLLEMGLIERAEEVWKELAPVGSDEENTRTKLSIKILETNWGYERDESKRAALFQQICEKWEEYLAARSDDDDGQFAYVDLLTDHARRMQGEAARNSGKAEQFLGRSREDLDKAKSRIDGLIEKARSESSVPDSENEPLMKARYYDIEIAYLRGLAHPIGSDERAEAYKAYIPPDGELIELFVWDYEDYITGYYALMLGGQMLTALERYDSAAGYFQNVLGVPVEFAGLRHKGYYHLAECYLQSGNASAALQAVEQMRSEYPEGVWGSYHGELALCMKARALSDMGDPGGGVELASEIVERDGPGKGEAAEAIAYIKEQNPDGIQLSCEVLYRASQGAIRRASASEREADWFRAITALHDAVAACVDTPENTRLYGLESVANLGHSFAQLDRHYEAALIYSRGRELAHDHWDASGKSKAGWPEDADAADFAYFAYRQWKNLEGKNSRYSGKGQAARDELARLYPNSEQVKELVYYIALELQGDARNLDRAKEYANAVAKHREALAKYAEVAKSSSKFGNSLFLSARSAYDIVRLQMRMKNIRAGSGDLTPEIQADVKKAYDAFTAYESWLETAPPPVTERELNDRLYNQRWSSFYKGRLAFCEKDFAKAADYMKEAKAEQDPDFEARRDFFIVEALVAGEKAEEAETVYASMKETYGLKHPMTSKAALELAKHYDAVYLDERNLGNEESANQVERKSIIKFYEFAQSGTATASNLLNIGRKFYKVASDLWDQGETDEAIAEYERSVWCFNRYLEAETDPKKRAKIEEDRAFILYFLGDYEGALTFFEPFFEKNPKRADVLIKLAWCYVALQNYERAYDAFFKLSRGLEEGSATWLEARYGMAHCLSKKNPTPEDVKAAGEKEMRPEEYLGKRGLELIEDMKDLFNIYNNPATGNPIRVRDPNDSARTVRDLETLWRDVEFDLRKRL